MWLDPIGLELSLDTIAQSLFVEQPQCYIGDQILAPEKAIAKKLVCFVESVKFKFLQTRCF